MRIWVLKNRTNIIMFSCSRDDCAYACNKLLLENNPRMVGQMDCFSFNFILPESYLNWVFEYSMLFLMLVSIFDVIRTYMGVGSWEFTKL